MKRIVSVLLSVMLLAVGLAACGSEGQHPDPIDKAAVRTVTISDSVFSSYLYQIADEEAVADLVKLYNELTLEPLADGEEKPEILTDTLYSITYYRESVEGGVFDKPVASVSLSPKGYAIMESSDGLTSSYYRLTRSFDEARLKEILQTYDANPPVFSMDGTE